MTEPMPKMEKDAIYLCECGNYQQYSDSKYCPMCGRKIDTKRTNALADEIEDLLVRWARENGRAKAYRLSVSR